jgi:hypothetical protein
MTWEAAQDEFSVFVMDGKERIVADVRANGMPMNQHLATAKLIAAAPELLALVKDFEAYLSSDAFEDGLPPGAPYLERVIHLIDRAEGREAK